MHLEEGNKNITNDIKESQTNLEKATKEGINQLKATAQHISENILTLETKLTRSTEYPDAELIEKVKHTEEEKKIYVRFLSALRFYNVLNVNSSMPKKEIQKHLDTKALKHN